MGSLSNLYISQSYQSLIHLGTNNTASATLIGLEDGLGNSIGVSVNTVGNLYLSGTFSASLQEGYLYVGNASGRTIAFPTSSLVTNINTGSLVTTSSFNQYTASTDIRLSNIEITTASVLVSINALNSATSSYVTEAESGSFLITASFDNGSRNLTFTKGNNTTFAVNIPDVSGSAGTFVTTSSFNDYTASNDQRVSSLETNSASVNVSINNLNASSASQQVSINALNTFTASQSTASIVNSINELNSFTSSANVRLNNLESTSASVNISISNINAATQSLQSQLATIGGQSGSWITESETGSFARYNVSNPWSADQTFTNISALSASFTYLQTIFETASIIYSSGSNQLGDELTDTQTLSGSVKVQGSLTINGVPVQTSSFDPSALNQATASLQAFTQSAEVRLNNIESTTASLNTSVSNLNTFSASALVSINALNGATGSYVTTASFNAYTSSNDQRVSSLETNSASVNTSISNLNTATQSLFVSASLALVTASINNDDITFTKGDGTQFTIQVATGSFALSASYAETASLAINAKDIVVDVKNTTGAQINKGTVVRIIGATGDNPLIGTASWEDDDNSANTLGFVVDNIANDAFGRVMTQGTLLGIDTDPVLGYTAGQLVYLSGSGQYTNVKPPAPYHEVRLGQVLRAQQNNGSVYVLIQNGYELTELHDVDINTGSLANNDLLAYDSASQQWVNKTVAGVGALTTASFNSLTGSFATTGSNTFIGTEIISGSVTMAVTGSGDIDTLRLIPWISSSAYNGGRDTTIIARDRQQVADNSSTSSFQPAVASPINIVFGAIANNSVQATISGSNNVIPAVRTSAAGLCDFSANQSWIGIMPATRNPRYGGVRITNSVLSQVVTAVNNTAGLSASLAQGYEGFGFGDAIGLTSTTVNAPTTLNPNSSSILVQNSAINGTTTINGNKRDFWPVAGYAAASASYTLVQNLTISGVTTITDQSSVSASFGAGQFSRGIAGGNVVLTNPIGATSNNNLQNFIVVGNSLTVTGSEASSQTGGGSAFFGRNNRLDGIANNTGNTIFAVGTGTGTTAATRKTGFLIDTGSNSFFEGGVNISGSLTINGVPYSIIDTASFATTGSNSFNGNQRITGSLTMSGSILFVDRSGNTSNVYLGLDALGMGGPSASPNALGNTITVAIGNGAMQYASGSNQNVAIGNNALQITTGSKNIAVGSEALGDNTTGNENIGIGAASLTKNTTGEQNVGIGFSALTENITGAYNLAIGSYALSSNISSSNSVAIGFNALQKNQSDTQTAIGVNALKENTFGEKNLAIGYAAAEQNTIGDYNTAIGGFAMNAATASQNNIAIGYQSMYAAESTNNNTAIGVEALYNVKSNSSANTAIGYQAMRNHFVDSFGGAGQNTAIGYDAMANVTTGSQNVGIGNGALRDASLAHQNVFIGHNAGLNTSGTVDYNTVVGGGSGRYIAGTRNTIFGNSNGNSLSSSANDNNTIIGCSISGEGNWANVIAIGNGNGDIKFFNSGSQTTITNDTLISGSLTTTGSATIGSVLQLTALNPLPTGADGQLAVSASNLYFFSGSAWNRIAFA